MEFQDDEPNDTIEEAKVISSQFLMKNGQSSNGIDLSPKQSMTKQYLTS